MKPNQAIWGVLAALTALGGCEEGMLWEIGDPLVLIDAGMSADGGQRADGGVSPDAGPGFDAGPISDAGAASDAGTDAGSAPDAGPVSTECETAVEAEERALTNAERTGAGLGPLSCDVGMGRAARLHAQHMCAQGYFDHVSLDGRRFTDRMMAQGVSYRAAGENIARGQQTPQSVHTSWMNSPGHRMNIMSPNYGRIGVGYDECGGRPLWVQVFAN